jgi:hypothetical protein
MPTTIQIQYSDTPGAAPTTLDLTVPAELAVNVADGQLYTRDTANNIRKLGGATDINGDTTFDGDVIVEGDLVVTNTTFLEGDLIVEGDTTIEGNTTIDGSLTVTNNIITGGGYTAGRPYRYWRLVNAACSGPYAVQLDEIEIFSPVGTSEVNVFSQAVFTGTDNDLGNPIDKLGDGEVNPLIAAVGWLKATVEDSGFYLQWDFGAGNAKIITAIRQYRAYAGDPDVTGYFSQFEMQASDDGDDWARTFYVSHQYVGGILPDVAQNSWSERYWLETTPAYSGGGSTYWDFVLPEKTASFNAVAGSFYIINTNAASGDVTMILPATPASGDRVGYAVRWYNINRDVIIDGGDEGIYMGAWASGQTTAQPALSAGDWGFSLIYDGTQWVAYDSLKVPVDN